MFTINKPLQFCYITEDQNEWITTGGVPYEGQEFVSKEIAVELLEALKLAQRVYSNGLHPKIEEQIEKAITKAEQ